MIKEEIFTRICRWIIAVFFPVALLLSILQIYAFNEAFYHMQYEKNNISAVTKISSEDLKEITTNLISYLKSDRENLDMKFKINNKFEEVFGEKEKQHMVDVKTLFDKGFVFKNSSIFLTVGALAMLFLMKRKRAIFQGLFHGSVGSLVIMVLLFILMQLNFFKAFTYFHQLFFTNDLWLLNPQTDVLIQMLPLEFFSSISTGVVSWFLILISIIGVISLKKLKIGILFKSFK